MKTRSMLAASIAIGLALAPAAFAEDSMSKPGMAKDKMEKSDKMEKKDGMAKPASSAMKDKDGMMDKKDSMAKDGMKK
jgi:pentapeptide MXKDX repeat protein